MQSIVDDIIRQVRIMFPDLQVDTQVFDRFVEYDNEYFISWHGSGIRNAYFSKTYGSSWLRFCHQGQICTSEEYNSIFLDHLRTYVKLKHENSGGGGEVEVAGVLADLEDERKRLATVIV